MKSLMTDMVRNMVHFISHGNSEQVLRVCKLAKFELRVARSLRIQPRRPVAGGRVERTHLPLCRRNLGDCSAYPAGKLAEMGGPGSLRPRQPPTGHDAHARPRSIVRSPNKAGSGGPLCRRRPVC